MTVRYPVGRHRERGAGRPHRRRLPAASAATGPVVVRGQRSACMDDNSATTPTAPRCRSGTATATPPRRTGPSTPTAPSRIDGGCLDVTGANYRQRHRRHLGPATAAPTSNGTPERHPRQPRLGICLDDPNGSTANGTQIQHLGLQRPQQPAVDNRRNASGPRTKEDVDEQGIEGCGVLTAVAAAVALALPLLRHHRRATRPAAESLSVNLASTRGPATGVGEGFLYGVSQDGTQPADQFLQPLAAQRLPRRRHVLRRLDQRQLPVRLRHPDRRQLDHRAGQAADPGAVPRAVPGAAQRPVRATTAASRRTRCTRATNGDCSNWISFIDATVGALQASGLHVRLRHLQRAGHLRLLAERGREQHPVLPDVGLRLPGAAAHRAERAHRRTVVRLHPAVAGRRSGRPGWRTSSRPARCRTGSPTTTRATSTTRSRCRRRSTAR